MSENETISGSFFDSLTLPKITESASQSSSPVARDDIPHLVPDDPSKLIGEGCDIVARIEWGNSFAG